MQDHSRIAKILGLPVVAVITVEGREIPILCSRPIDREFLQKWVNDCVPKPRQSLSEFLRTQRAIENSEGSSVDKNLC